MSPLSEIKVKNIDHLGIVAGLIDEIRIVETINSKLGIDSREKVSAGTVVKAILINGLGFVSRPLYLFSQFFEDKAIEDLLGAGVKSEYINDDKIGRVMDELYKYGLNNLFIEIVLSIININSESSTKNCISLPSRKLKLLPANPKIKKHQKLKKLFIKSPE